MTAPNDIESTEDSNAVSVDVHRPVRQLSDGWNHLSTALVGMSISDPRWKPAVDWLNGNRQYQKPIPRLPNAPAMPPRP